MDHTHHRSKRLRPGVGAAAVGTGDAPGGNGACIVGGRLQQSWVGLTETQILELLVQARVSISKRFVGSGVWQGRLCKLNRGASRSTVSVEYSDGDSDTMSLSEVAKYLPPSLALSARQYFSQAGNDKTAHKDRLVMPAKEAVPVRLPANFKVGGGVGRGKQTLELATPRQKNKRAHNTLNGKGPRGQQKWRATPKPASEGESGGTDSQGRRFSMIQTVRKDIRKKPRRVNGTDEVQGEAFTVETYRLLGNRAVQKGNGEDAIHFYSQALELDGRNHVLLSNRAAAYMLVNGFKDALLDAQRCINLAPKYARGYSRKASALKGLQRWGDARQVYRHALAMFPEDPGLLKGFAEMQA